MVFGALVGLMLAASPPPFAGSARWDFLDERPPRPEVVRQPTAFLFDRAIEEMQGALGDWQKERRAFNKDAAALERIRARREAPAVPAPAPELLETPAAVAPSGDSKVKIIELAPPEAPEAPEAEEAEDDPSEPLVEGDGRVEAEMRRLDAELTERRRRCEADPEACAKARELRKIVREGNRAWDEAIEEKERARAEAIAAKERAREAAIEAEAKRIQAELDAARRREAEERAKKMGGAIDSQGNFVDEDLQRELDEQEAK